MKRHDGSQPTVGFLTPYLTFILCAHLLAILFILGALKDTKWVVGGPNGAAAWLRSVYSYDRE